jgi:hypothetical protein
MQRRELLQVPYQLILEFGTGILKNIDLSPPDYQLSSPQEYQARFNWRQLSACDHALFISPYGNTNNRA